MTPARPKTTVRKPAYILRLYINTSTSKSLLALRNIKKVCEEHLKGLYHLDVIDVRTHAHLARDEQIVAVPTLIKQLPQPLRRLVGDMSDVDKVLFGLDVRGRE